MFANRPLLSLPNKSVVSFAWGRLGLLGIICALNLNAPARADLMGADERLEAIRNSLVQAALDGPTEV